MQAQVSTLLCRCCESVMLMCSWNWNHGSFFFLQCQYYVSFLTALLNKLRSINYEIVSLRPTALAEVILYGDKKLNDKLNQRIPTANTNYIENT